MKSSFFSSWKDILEIQNAFLKQAQSDLPVEDLLKSLTDRLDALHDRHAVSVMLKGEGETLIFAAGSRLSSDYIDQINPLPYGPNVGSCGTAAFEKKQVIVDNMLTHPLWADFRHLQPACGYMASWSQPMLSKDNSLLGTFAVYFKEPRAPSEMETDIIESLGNTVGFILERKKYEDTLKTTNASLAKKVAARTAELELQKEKAEEANTLKTRFLAAMSHELRTPLNGIIGAGNLLSNSKLNKEQCELNEMSVNSAQLLLTLVNDLLDLSTIESGEFKLNLEPGNLRQNLEEVCALFHVSGKAKQVPINLSISETVSARYALDYMRIKQIIFNLVGNALKFTSDGSVEIRVSEAPADTTPTSLRFEVEDNGIGISKDHHQTIFQLFRQADASTTRKYGGTGLGLAICKKLIEGMGGQIGVESQLGEGARFWFEIPATTCNVSVKENASNTLEVAGITATARRQVLLVEDSAVNRTIATKLLETLNCEVDTAQNGKESLDLIEGKTYDLVFMDCMMPEMDGYAATKIIREREQTSSAPTTLPIVALTANAMHGDEEKCLSAGMTDYLTKPFDAKSLEAMLSKHI
ncbi:GAF domain-containing hybrid sensor histidine kinase/response regulator [Shimia marina]|uniref:histidine kinase n=1 Tax=Shimia marina TaxID=321267 RepID=A0A0P1EJQ9_9RHOB|nr:ATP-binding protein [Shimia marina]CUH50767.1 Aerobic respiration control sensor protein ArcB [Shimia marina]SFE65518.1 Signal transduction histidine kinase [Shimia marina]